MKFVNMGALAIVAVLSVAAGMAKLLQAPQEVEFFRSAGLGLWPLVALGGAQVIGAALLIFPRFRPVGAAVAALGFLTSTVVIWITGQVGFAAISLLPVALAGFVGFVAIRRSRQSD